MQAPDTKACESQVLQGVQVSPDPKYPVLQVHDDVSYDVFPVQALENVACASHVLHGRQLLPLP